MFWICLWVLALAYLVVEMIGAPIGYEDDMGFHYGEPTVFHNKNNS